MFCTAHCNQALSPAMLRSTCSTKMEKQIIKRTTSNDKDFVSLIQQLDHELWNELQEDQAQYDQYNKVPDLDTVVLLYVNGQPAASGCFKKYNDDTIEVKRMFVVKKHRGRGLSKTILTELESWAMEKGFKYAILETSIHFIPATTLYKSSGYKIIPNYDQYEGLTDSVCMKKELF
jgi:GNAT superfamily N-acetyltransferase